MPIAKVIVTDDQGVVFGGFELTGDDIGRSSDYTKQAIGAQVLEQLPGGEMFFKGTGLLPEVASDPRDLIVSEGTTTRGENLYVVLDRTNGEVVFESGYKPAVIGQAQHLKGWTPIDGSEETYAQQILDHGGEAR